MNENKNEKDVIRKTYGQCKNRWNSMRRKYLEERACEIIQEELKVNDLFLIKSMKLLIHLSKLEDYPMQLTMVKNQKQKVHQKEKKKSI